MPASVTAVVAPEPSPWSWSPAGACRLETPVCWLRLDGPDTRRFLHGQTSQAVERAAPGSWLSTCCIGPTARMKGLAELLLDADGAWLVITAGDGEAVRQALDRVLFPADAVSLGPLRPGLLVQPLGPTDATTTHNTATHTAATHNAATSTAATTRAATAGAATASAAAAIPTAAIPTADSATARTADPADGASLAAGAPAGRCWQPGPEPESFWLGECLLLLQPAASLPPALDQRRPITAEEAERWRIQRGQPRAPQELNDDTNPFELGLAARVSLNKGCYVGQETLARLATYDGVKQQVRRWFLSASAAASLSADQLISGAELVQANGDRAGRISSALRLDDGGWIGLALVRRACLDAAWLELAAAPVRLWLSTPPELVAPPQGGGGKGTA